MNVSALELDVDGDGVGDYMIEGNKAAAPGSLPRRVHGV